MAFAVTDSKNTDLLLDAVNYAISNLGQSSGNGSGVANALVVDNTTGIISNSTTGEVYGYLYQYVAIRYADTADGQVNFSPTPTNRLYYGVYNTTTPVASTNPTDYVWYQVTGGFGTTKSLFYSTLGGRQIQFAAVTTAPNTNFVIVPTTAIDLDLVTAASTTTIVTQMVYQRNAGTPSTPTGGTYDFGTAQLLAPFGWYASIPSGTDPVWSSQTTFVNSGGSTVVPPNVPWTTPVETASNGADALSNFTVIAYTRLASTPSTPTANTGSWNFTTSTGTPPTGAQTWSLTPPSGNIQLWGSQSVASITGSQGTDNTLTWSTPYQVADAGAAGADGVSIYYYTVFQQATTAPATPTGGSFNFGTFTGTPPLGWANNPQTGNILVWASSAQATNPGPTGIWTGGNSWSTPVQYTGQTGADGTAGQNGYSATCNPSLVDYIMQTNGTWVAQSTPIAVNFNNGNISDSMTVFGNVSANGQVTYGYGNSNPNISIIGPTTISTNPSAVQIGFLHTTSNSTATALTTTTQYPYTQASGLGGQNVISGGNVVATIAAAPSFNISYSNGQFFSQYANGSYSPSPVANVIKTTANIVVNRGNLIVGAVGRDISYNTVSKLWSFTANANVANTNPQYFSFGIPQVSPASFFSSTSYIDPIGSSSTNLAVSVIQSGQNGNAGAQGSRGIIPMAYVVTPSSPLTATQSQLTSWFSANRANTVPPIGTGYTPIVGDTASFTWIDTANAATISLVETYGNGNLWANANAQVIPGNVIVTGSITAGKLAANDVYALTIRGGNVTPGNATGIGYWAQANTGNAYFGGNLRIGNSTTIGNNLLVGNNATIGGNLTILDNARIGNSANIQNNANIGTFATIGSNLIVGNSASIGDNLTVGLSARIGNNAIIGNSVTIGNNLSVGNSMGIGNLLVVGSNAIIGGNLQIGNTARIGNNLVIANNAQIGNSLVIGANAQIGANLYIGNNLITAGNAFIGNNSTIGANVIIGNNANIGANIIIGNNATILNNLTVGNNTIIGNNLTVTNLITAGQLNANTVGLTQLQPGVIQPSIAIGNITVKSSVATTTSTGSWEYAPNSGGVGYQEVCGYSAIYGGTNWVNGTVTPKIQVQISGTMTTTGLTGQPLQFYLYVNGPNGAAANQIPVVSGTSSIGSATWMTPWTFGQGFSGTYAYTTNVSLGSSFWNSSVPTIIGWSLTTALGSITNTGNTSITNIKLSTYLFQ